MSLTTAGAQIIPKALFNLNSPTLFTSGANCALGVGDSSTAFAISQTDLQAATNKYRQQSTSASESAGVVTIVATFGTSVANFEWIEWGVFNSAAASSGGTMLGRKVESPSLGTKTSSQVWTLTSTCTFAAA